jgi:hypothetical protein
VQGRVSRRRSTDDVEAIVRQNAARGVQSFFITDDNFARNKDWEPIFDRLIARREQQGFRIIQAELPIDFVEFFILTPLPGSEDHQKLAAAGVAMDADLNRYDTFHVVTAHASMSREVWERTYWYAWLSYYTFEHMRTLLRRAAATRISLDKMLSMLISFWSLSLVEHCHPLEGGYLRRRVRTERRPGLPLVPAWRFWPAAAAGLLVKHARFALMASRLLMVRHRLKRDPGASDYRDLALTPVSDEAGLALLTTTEATRRAAGTRLCKLAAAG